MDLNLSKFTFSLVWTRTNLTKNFKIPYQFLAKKRDYDDRFKRAQHDTLYVQENLEQKTPWQKGHSRVQKKISQGFWEMYLDFPITSTFATEHFPGHSAWQYLVPLLIPIPLELRTDPPGFHKALWELYIYPYGVTLRVKVELDRQFASPLHWDVATDTAFQLRRNVMFNAVLPQNRPSILQAVDLSAHQKYSLNQLGTYLLDIIEDEIYGPEKSLSQATDPEPFTLFAPLISSHEPTWLDKRPTDQAFLRQLRTLTLWRPAADGEQPISLRSGDNMILLGQTAGLGDFTYNTRRGRVIWYPSLFMSDDEWHRNSIRCYTNNLTFASMQTESMCGLVVQLAAKLSEGKRLTQREKDLGRRAAIHLSALFGGSYASYRSLSVQRQIQQNGWQEAIEALRGELMPGSPKQLT